MTQSLFLMFQITERLRDPRGLRRGGFTGPAPRNFVANGPRRGFLRPVSIKNFVSLVVMLRVFVLEMNLLVWRNGVFMS